MTALHVMRWTYEGDHVKAEAVCLAAPDADCRLTSKECDCEWWGRLERRDDGTIWHIVGDVSEWHREDWHEMVPSGECNVCLFINESGYAMEQTPDGECPEFVIGETPFEPVWENDGCSWRPLLGGAS